MLKPKTSRLVFIDFKKAFDSVHKGLLMKLLKAYGIAVILEELIAEMCTGTTAKVVTADCITEAFDILARVLQGDTTRRIWVHFLACTASRRIGIQKLADLEFADDITAQA